MATIEIQLDAYVLPDGHRVFKLFPGETYRLNKEILALQTAFLDIRGLDALSGDPASWTDEQLRGIVREDRIVRDISGRKPSKRGNAQDSKRLRFLRNLWFEAREGDLVIVPLGKGLDGEVAIGEFATAPGDLRRVKVTDRSTAYETWGRPIRWRAQGVKRRRFSSELNRHLHAPTAFHVLGREWLEDIYLAAYKSFTYEDIYVATFPSEKESLTTADQANIGIWFNGISVIHERLINGETIGDEEDFVDLGLQESGVELELIRNSPWGVVMRTVGPLAFSTLALYSASVNGATLNEVANATVTAHTVAGAPDKCAVEVPPDLETIADGLGLSRWKANCRIGKRVQSGATVKDTARLKEAPKKPK